MLSNFSSKEFNLDSEDENQTGDTLEHHILMHLDIDYFFAQVEILKQPELRGKPVIVGHTKARETGRGVVLTCSYEARKFGVHSGLAMKIALDRCPDAIIVKSSYEEYREISKSIMDILKNFEVPMRQAGIDEAYLDITTLVDDYDDAQYFALRLKKRIFDKVRLTVSIGIGPTLKIAKISSDYNKPDGITVMPPERLPELFTGLPLIKIPGIGKKTAGKLEKQGLKTCDQLMGMTELDLREQFGSFGGYFLRIIEAKTSNTIKPRGQRKSISHSRTFVGDPFDIDTSMEYFDKLFESSHSTLIKEKFETKTIDLRIRFNGFDTITRSKSLDYYTTEKEPLYREAKHILTPHLSDPRGIRLIGVGFSNLRKIPEDQTSLDEFTDFTEPGEVSIPSNSTATMEKPVKDPTLDDFF